MSHIPKILIIGGGAAGLQLATRLGRSLGKNKLAEINLIDNNRIHLWKPLLHEVVSGSMDTGRESLSFRAHSAEHHYYFHLGEFCGITSDQQAIKLAPLMDHHNKEILPSRHLPFDFLVLAMGSHSNDFGIPGVHKHCFTLNNAAEAEDLHLTILNRFLQFSENADTDEKVKIAIVGGGATGVELTAELFASVDRLEGYGVHKIHHNSLEVTLVEAAARILPALPESLSHKAQKTLEQQGANVQTGVMVKRVEPGLLITDSAEIEADIIIWAAGIKAPQCLVELNLEINRINQLHVDNTLSVKGYENIYAIGDCACLQEDNNRPVPSTAQAAHQMAKLCAVNLENQIKGLPLKHFQYEDHGTLVALSHFQALGNLLDNMLNKNWIVEGKVAHYAYASLYRHHQFAIHGVWKTLWLMLLNLLEKRIKPKMKLY